MALLTITSPHAHKQHKSVTQVMTLVLVALIPGIIAQWYSFGWGNIINIVLASIFALGIEAICIKLRKRPANFYLKDCSALVTAWLLAIALPPFSPWWLTLSGIGFAIIFAKQIYGGIGYNPFNPAMVAYALLLVSFPVQMTTLWATPSQIGQETLGFIDTLHVILGSTALPDVFTSATPLDTFKHEIAFKTYAEIIENPIFQGWIAPGWDIVNLAFLAGGIFLLITRVFTWHIPLSFLVALIFISFISTYIFGHGVDDNLPVSMHLMTGATMFCAFFIATDPVSAATTRLGKIIYGAGIALFVYIIRTYGNYPDAVAFAVLLMNFGAPLIDYYTQPRTYGHKKAVRGKK